MSHTRGTLRTALRRALTERGHDVTVPELAEAIERTLDAQVLISPDGSRFSVTASNGDVIRSTDPIGKLANALSARLEGDRPLEPKTLEEVAAAQRRMVPYGNP